MPKYIKIRMIYNLEYYLFRMDCKKAVRDYLLDLIDQTGEAAIKEQFFYLFKIFNESSNFHETIYTFKPYV